MKTFILALLFILTIPAHAADGDQTPVAWARTLTGDRIILLYEPCQFLTTMRQYIIVDLDSRILGGGCWNKNGNSIFARDGRSLHPTQWPIADFHRWK